MTVRTKKTDPAPEATDTTKTRRCLICTRPFPSTWAGERICRKCKATSTWRSG